MKKLARKQANETVKARDFHPKMMSVSSLSTKEVRAQTHGQSLRRSSEQMFIKKEYRPSNDASKKKAIKKNNFVSESEGEETLQLVKSLSYSGSANQGDQISSKGGYLSHDETSAMKRDGGKMVLKKRQSL